MLVLHELSSEHVHCGGGDMAPVMVDAGKVSVSLDPVVHDNSDLSREIDPEFFGQPVRNIRVE